MNKLFQHIQFFVECRDAESIEPMGNPSAFIMSCRKNSVREIEASRDFPNKV